MDARTCAYSYLKERSHMCDYEIQTDLLSSEIGLAIHTIKHIKELGRLAELVYHCNGSIRGKVAITCEDYEWLNQVYEYYATQVGELNYFVVPQGSHGSCVLHRLRSLSKVCVRLAYKIQQEGKDVSNIVLDFLNLLSNTFFMMAVYENRCEKVEEVQFVSKSYGC